MNTKRSVIIGIIAALLVASGLAVPAVMDAVSKKKPTPIPIVSLKVSPTRTASWTPSATPSPSSSPSSSPTVSATVTEGTPPSETPTPTQTTTPTTTSTPTPTSSVTFAPHHDASACPSHDTHTFHTLWDAVNNCHYDHEHGEDPFTQAVSDAFPGFDLYALLGNVGIGHTNPSGPMENTHKHGGFKWQVQTQTPHGCDNANFEGATYGIDAAVVQYHAFGDYSIEFDTRIHSAALLVRVCNADSPSDKGYMYVVQLQDYGQRVIPYQGAIMPYPDNPAPSYQSSLGPYLTDDCVNGGVIQCRASLSFVTSRNLNVASIWTSKPTGFNANYPGDSLFKLLFRVRDVYQLFDWNVQTYPFRFLWVCSTDNGVSYNPSMAGCRWNNSTTRVHEIGGTVPSAWDNLDGFDTDTRIGRITAEGYVNQYGTQVNLSCTAPSPDCYPVKLVSMFVGTYGDEVTAEKVSNQNAVSNPERDICFTSADILINCDTTGAISSGWIGMEN